MVGAAGLAGLIGGLSMRASQISQHPHTAINLSAAEAISFRFPSDWHDAESALEDTAQTVAAAEPTPAAAPARYAVASATSLPVVFNPKPMREAVTAAPAMEPEPAPPWVMAAIPPLPKPRPRFEAINSTVAAPATEPAKHAAVAPKPKPQSNAVLNGAQIASIKRRLNLTPDQERYWPAVEAELRKMEYKKDAKGTRTAAIDTSKMNVDGLRNAGFPLVMSFSDDQRRELKSLAHLLGLEGAMSGL